MLVTMLSPRAVLGLATAAGLAVGVTVRGSGSLAGLVTLLVLSAIVVALAQQTLP